MRFVHTLLLAATVFMASCSAEPELQLPLGEPVEVVAGTVVRTLRPEEEAYRKLQAWLSLSRSGWSPYYGTHPSGPQFIVRTKAHQLYVYRNSALLRTPTGLFSHSLAPGEVAFLAEANSQ